MLAPPMPIDAPPPSLRSLSPRIALALAIFLAVQTPVTAPFGRQLWAACATATVLTLPLTLLLWRESARLWTRLLTCVAGTALGVIVTGLIFGVLITWHDGSLRSDGPAVRVTGGLSFGLFVGVLGLIIVVYLWVPMALLAFGLLQLLVGDRLRRADRPFVPAYLRVAGPAPPPIVGRAGNPRTAIPTPPHPLDGTVPAGAAARRDEAGASSSRPPECRRCATPVLRPDARFCHVCGEPVAG